MPSKKSKKKGGAPKQVEDDDWEALLEAEAQVEPTEEAPKEVNEQTEETTTDAPAPAAEDAASAFLAAQGLGDGGDDTGGGGKKKKKKKKKGAGAGGEKPDEKVSDCVGIDEVMSSIPSLYTNYLI